MMATTLFNALTLDSTSQDKSQQSRRSHFYPKGETIPLLPQGLWFVEKGIVQLNSLNSNGENVLLGWVIPSNFFGSIVSHNLHSYEPMALSDVHLKWFSMIEIEASPNLAHSVLQQLFHRIHQMEALLSLIGERRVENRLQKLLLLLKQEMGDYTPNGVRIKARLTHQNLANAIGTTRVTITRLLSKWQQDGWISFDIHRHIVINPIGSAEIGAKFK